MRACVLGCTTGILSNSGDLPSLITFTLGVFLANMPEALSSSVTMRACHIRKSTILFMWAVVWLGTGVGAALGALAFPPAGAEGLEYSASLVVAGIEGLCGGAMLTMISATVLPEAFEQGGDIVGMCCLLGFMCALAVKSIGMALAPSTAVDAHSG